MSRMTKWLVGVSAALLASHTLMSAAAYDLGDRRLALIDDPLRIKFQSANAPGREKMRQAIAAGTAAHGWQLSAETDGRMQMTRSVRQHSMSVELTYDADGYVIRYLESSNLLYREPKPGLRAIHRSYNVWIDELVTAINAAAGAHVSERTMGFASLGQVDAVPLLSNRGREAYKTFLAKPTPRAFAIASNGAYGFAWGHPRDDSDRVDKALQICGTRGTECKVYAVDDHVVWNDQAAPERIAPETPLPEKEPARPPRTAAEPYKGFRRRSPVLHPGGRAARHGGAGHARRDARQPLPLRGAGLPHRVRRHDRQCAHRCKGALARPQNGRSRERANLQRQLERVARHPLTRDEQAGAGDRRPDR
jgi:hypothetical protein